MTDKHSYNGLPLTIKGVQHLLEISSPEEKEFFVACLAVFNPKIRRF